MSRQSGELPRVLASVLDQELDRLRGGEIGWRDWLGRARAFGEYGFVNTLLIPAQRPEASDVRTYDDWQLAGRQVRKGETAVRVLLPRGTARPVFDVAQTDGPPVPEQPSLSAEQVWQAVRGAAVDLGFYVDRGERWTYAGRSGRVLRVAGEVDDVQAALLLAHQLAHVLRSGDRPDAVARDCFGARRVEADSVAHLVLAGLGVDPAIEFAEAPLWAGTDARTNANGSLRVVGERIIRTAARLRSHVPGPHAKGRGDLLAAVNAAHEYYQDQLSESWGADYLAGRGIAPTWHRHWQIGHAPAGGRALAAHLRALGHTADTIVAAGLCRRDESGSLRDFFRDRIVFPIRDADGAVRGFIGRRADGGRGPKYLNSPESAIFRKSTLLFGLHEGGERFARGARPVIVEGVLDAIAVNASCEAHAAVAVGGCALTTGHVRALSSAVDLDTVGAVVLMDGDSAGQAAIQRAVPALSGIRGPVSAVVLGGGRDPAATMNDLGPSALRQALADGVPLIDVAVDAAVERAAGTLTTGEGRLAAVRAAVAVIAVFDPADAARHVLRVADRTGVDSPLVTSLLIAEVSPDGAGSAADDFPGEPVVEAVEDRARVARPAKISGPPRRRTSP